MLLQPTKRAYVSHIVLFSVAALAIVHLSCSRPEQIDLPPLGVNGNHKAGGADGGSVRPYVVPDGKMPCNHDADCDDGIDCTFDKCLVEGYCAHTPDWNPCDDGVFCNGLESCDPVQGCIAAERGGCDDSDPCTIDQCDEESRNCNRLLRDDDGDGEGDQHCPGGTDCDDHDPTRTSKRPETCSDLADNDCDGQTDEDDCVRSRHDLCEDALVVSQSGTYTLDLRGAKRDYVYSCSGSIGPEVVLRLQLDRVRDLRIRAIDAPYSQTVTQPAPVVIDLWARCYNSTDEIKPSDEIKCGSSSNGEVRARALSQGSYYVLVTSSAPQVTVDIQLSDPTTAPGNAHCASALDISAGGSYHGDFVGAGDDAFLVCGASEASGQADAGATSGAEDLVYRFTTFSEQDVEILLVTQGEERMAYRVSTACVDQIKPTEPTDDPSHPIACVTGSPATARLHRLPAGTYYLVVEGPAEKEVDFDLVISFLDPTPRPLGDSCDNPAPLALGVVEQGSLADKQDTMPLSCGTNFHDMVFRFDILEPTDISLRIDGGDSTMILAVEQQCGIEDITRSCVKCQPAVNRLRNLQPGAYYAVVESTVDTNFLIVAEPLPVTVPTPVSGNESCADAITVPSQGGLYAGTTEAMRDDYQPTCAGTAGWGSDAVFKLELSETKRVQTSLEASFDSMLFRLTDTEEQSACTSPAPDNCDDASLYCSSSFLDEVLDPGVHYFIVDGRSQTKPGRYYFEVIVTDPI